MSDALVFVATTTGTPPDHLALTASRADIPQGCNKEFLTSYTAGTAVESQQTETPSSWKRGLLASLHSFSMKVGS